MSRTNKCGSFLNPQAVKIRILLCHSLNNVSVGDILELLLCLIFSGEFPKLMFKQIVFDSLELNNFQNSDKESF